MLPTILVQRGLPLTQILVLLLVQALVAIVGYAMCGFLIDCYGRRPVLFLYYFVGAFFHLWFAYAAGSGSMSPSDGRLGQSGRLWFVRRLC